MEGVMGMRDIIAYHYFDIDAVIVFDVMKNNLPAINMTIDKMLFDIWDTFRERYRGWGQKTIYPRMSLL